MKRRSSEDIKALIGEFKREYAIWLRGSWQVHRLVNRARSSTLFLLEGEQGDGGLEGDYANILGDGQVVAENIRSLLRGLRAKISDLEGELKISLSEEKLSSEFLCSLLRSVYGIRGIEHFDRLENGGPVISLSIQNEDEKEVAVARLIYDPERLTLELFLEGEPNEVVDEMVDIISRGVGVQRPYREIFYPQKNSAFFKWQNVESLTNQPS